MEVAGTAVIFQAALDRERDEPFLANPILIDDNSNIPNNLIPRYTKLSQSVHGVRSPTLLGGFPFLAELDFLLRHLSL